LNWGLGVELQLYSNLNTTTNLGIGGNLSKTYIWNENTKISVKKTGFTYVNWTGLPNDTVQNLQKLIPNK